MQLNASAILPVGIELTIDKTHHGVKRGVVLLLVDVGSTRKKEERGKPHYIYTERHP
jgi:hypothetical protein